jgi:hypothetical protein
MTRWRIPQQRDAAIGQTGHLRAAGDRLDRRLLQAVHFKPSREVASHKKPDSVRSSR